MSDAGSVPGRLGLLRTMVFTHLPSNVLLAAVAFAPNLSTAIALLLGRFALSQMDVPTRQAYVVGVVDPSERTATAAYTNAARTLAARRPRSSQAPRSAPDWGRPPDRRSPQEHLRPRASGFSFATSRFSPTDGPPE